MKTLSLGTKNPDKAREIQDILLPIPLDLRPLPGEIAPAPEDHETLEQNAAQKATAYARATNSFCLADDTGLEVDAIDGQPGAHAARYAGPDATYADNRQKLLDALSDVPAQRRTARFRTVVCLANPAGEILATAEGALEGVILEEELGSGGFGYDAIFRPEGEQRTLAELSDEEKNDLSHRARALRAIKPRLLELL